MELKYPYILIIGLIVIAVLIFLSFFQKKKYSDGKKLSGLLGIEESAYYKRKIIIFKMLNVAIAFVLGLMFSVGLAFLLEFLDKTIKTEQDVEELLGLPVFGLISPLSEDVLNGNQITERRRKQSSK